MRRRRDLWLGSLAFISATALATLGSSSPPAASAPPASHVVTSHDSAFDTTGYWLVATDGGIFGYGNTSFFGSHGGTPLNKPIVGMASTPDGNGYWMVASDGGIFTYGDALFYGSHGGTALNKPIVAMAGTPNGGGYWMVASDGGIFSYGDAPFYGSHGGTPLNKPIVGMASTPDGGGYWLVASDGGIFGYGDAPFYGSHGGTPLNKPIVAMASTPNGGGYWLVASDGGIFSYGNALFYGSHGGTPLNSPIVGMASTPTGGGYWLVASDGGIFAYGNALFYGSQGGTRLNQPVVGMAGLPLGHGYWGTDGCYYYLQGNQWFSNACVRYALDQNGQPILDLWNFYAYPGPGQIPKVLEFQVDRSDPAYFTFRVEDPKLYAIFSQIAWVRVPNSGTAPAQYLVCSQPPLSGTCTWFTLDQIEAALAQGGSASVPPSLESLPPSAEVESTVYGAEEANANLEEGFANTWGAPDCTTGCEAYSVDGADEGTVYDEDLARTGSPVAVPAGPAGAATSLPAES